MNTGEPKMNMDEPKMNIRHSIADGTYVCDPCNFETKYSGNLQTHFKTQKHLIKTNSLIEDSANITDNDFDEHKMNMDEPKMNIRPSIVDGTYVCDPCNFETKYSQNLQAHFKTLKHLGNTEMSCEESVIFFENIAY